MVGISPDNFCGNYLNELGGSVMLNGIVTGKLMHIILTFHPFP